MKMPAGLASHPGKWRCARSPENDELPGLQR